MVETDGQVVIAEWLGSAAVKGNTGDPVEAFTSFDGFTS